MHAEIIPKLQVQKIVPRGFPPILVRKGHKGVEWDRIMTCQMLMNPAQTYRTSA